MGFQVEELARMEYPDGELIEGNDWNYELLAAQTAELLQRRPSGMSSCSSGPTSW